MHLQQVEYKEGISQSSRLDLTLDFVGGRYRVGCWLPLRLALNCGIAKVRFATAINSPGTLELDESLHRRELVIYQNPS